ncbi:uncharacterized protein [Ptychodera flava]|uniref:uncharacterized protein n=1 Tax=Ptychodera flava TaxID=63121 RepID=UPI003969C2C5
MGNSPARLRRSSSLSGSPEATVLTKDHEKILVQTWHSIRGDLEKIGLLMFTGLFEHHPEAKTYFGLPGVPITEEDKQITLKIREHGLRFMNVVRDVLALIAEKNRAQATSLMRELGKRHFHYNADINLIDVFGQQFIMAIQPTLSKSWDKKVEDAWIQLFKFIAYSLKVGMLEAIDENRPDEPDDTQRENGGAAPPYRRRTLDHT